MQGHYNWLLLVEHYLASSYVIHGTDQPQFTLVDHLAQYHAPIEQLFHGELHIHLCHSLHKPCIS